MKRTAILFFLFVVCIYTAISQSRKFDSLRHVIKAEKEDTNKVNSLISLASIFYTTKPDTTVLLAEQANALAVKLGWKKGEASALNNAAIGYWVQGYYPKALDYYMKALKIMEDLGNKRGQASVLGNIGLVCHDQGDYPKALDYYLKALKMGEELGNKKVQASNLINIGTVYDAQSDYSKALVYYQRALKIDEEIKYKQGQAVCLSNMGIIYKEQATLANCHKTTRDSLLKKGIDYYLMAQKIAEELGNKRLQADNLANIGSTYECQGNHSKAFDSYTRSLKMDEELGNKQGQAINLGNLGALYTKTGKFKDAEECLLKAIKLDSSIGNLNDLRLLEENMSHLYDTTGRGKLALIWYKKSIVLKDTLFNINKNKALTQKEMTYQFEKKEAAEKAEQDKRDAIAAQESKKQAVIRNSFMGGFVLMFALAFFIFRGYRQKQKANEIISLQKSVVEEKQKEILDSIHYAQRIQKALLASDALLSKYLPEYFVLYKPKDIVSGDFYWVTLKDGRFYLAVCDSTGHGVPGAFMSLLNISFLNEAITEKSIVQPNEIFNHARKRLIENISQDGGQDGMDGVLISLDAIKASATLSYSAAYDVPLVVRNNAIIELKADKMPVGTSPNENISFTHNTFELQKGDTIYLFSDGFADQFGGAKGKKFKYQQLQQLIMDNAQLTMKEQKQALDQAFENWRGGLEQVDDVLVIGIRV